MGIGNSRSQDNNNSRNNNEMSSDGGASNNNNNNNEGAPGRHLSVDSDPGGGDEPIDSILSSLQYHLNSQIRLLNSLNANQLAYKFELDSNHSDDSDATNNTDNNDVAPESTEQKMKCLKESDIYQATLSHCGDSRSKKKKTNCVNIARRVADREIGACPRFTQSDKCSINNKLLPNEMSKVDSYRSKVFVGQYVKDGEVLLTACQDQKIRFYQTSGCRYKLFNTIEARDVGWSVLDVAVSPDGAHVMYSSWSDYIHQCNIYGESESHMAFNLEPSEHRFCCFSLRVSRDGSEILAGASDRCLYVYDKARNCRTLRIEAHEDDVNAVCFADDASQILYSGGDDGLVKIWDRRTLSEEEPKPVGCLAGHCDGITFIDSKGDSRYLISNCKDQSIKLWDVRKCSTTDAVRQTKKAVAGQSWDYRWQSYPKKARERKISGDTSVMTYFGHHTILHTLIRAYFSPAFNTGQRFIYCGCASGACVVYDLLTGKMVARLKGHQACVRDVAWHPYNNEICSSSWDSVVGLWSYDGKDEDEKHAESESDVGDSSDDSNDGDRRSNRRPSQLLRMLRQNRLPLRRSERIRNHEQQRRLSNQHQGSQVYTDSVSSSGYYWALENDLVSVPAGKNLRLGSGAPLAIDGVEIGTRGLHFNGNNESCLVLDSDQCLSNPGACGTSGMSFSVWVKMANTFSTDIQYILDSGADEYGAKGVAIYYSDSQDGSTYNQQITFLVSTGTEYWKAVISGMLKASEWNNIGFRWSKTAVGNITLGLEVFINTKRTAWKRLASTSSSSSAVSTSSSVQIGCKKDGTAPGELYMDNIAVWYTRLSDGIDNRSIALAFMGSISYKPTSNLPCFESVAVAAYCMNGVQADRPSKYVDTFNSKEWSEGYLLKQVPPYMEDTSIAIDGDCTPANPQGWGGSHPMHCADTKNEIMHAIEYRLDFTALDLAQACVRTVLRAGPNGLSVDDLVYIHDQFDVYGVGRVAWLNQSRAVVNDVTNAQPYLDVVQIISKLTESSPYGKMWSDAIANGQKPALLTQWIDLADRWFLEIAKLAPETTGLVREANHTIVAICSSEQQAISTQFLFPNYADKNNFNFYETRPSWCHPTDYITLPRNAFYAWNGSDTKLSFVGKMYNQYDFNLPAYLDDRLSLSDTSVLFFINGRILSLTIYPKTPDFPEFFTNNSLQYRIQHRVEQDDRPFMKAAVLCVSWNFNIDMTKMGAWDTNGCNLVWTNDTHSLCSCSHTTDFGILMEDRKLQMSMIPYYIAAALLIISILLLLIYPSVYSVCPTLHSELYFMYVNVMLALFFALVFYCIAVVCDRGLGSIVFSACSHYSYSAAYVWMFFAGLYLIRASKNLALKEMAVYYVLAGWSLPAILVCVLVGLNTHYYGLGFRGLPSIASYYLWIFVGGHFFTAFLGLLVLMFAMYKARSANFINPEDSKDMKMAIIGQLIFWAYVVVVWILVVFIYLVPIQSAAIDILFELLNAMHGIVAFLLLGVLLPSFRAAFKNTAREPPFVPLQEERPLEEEMDEENPEDGENKQLKPFDPYEVTEGHGVNGENHLPPPIAQ